MNQVLRIKNLTKTFGNKVILDDLNMSVEKNEFVCVLGPSGCGKTTFLRCVAGFEKFSGSIECNGKTVATPAPDRIMVFQDYNQLYPWKTVEKNVQYPLKIKGIKDRAELKEISEKYIKMVGLDGYQKFYPHELSGGMKQRVAIAKSLALRPELILMDEPFAALDAMTRSRLQSELLKITEAEKTTVIFITHNIQEALQLGTRIIVQGYGGKIKIDIKNPLPRPVSPASEGFAELWDRLHTSLYG
jgi:NitT/TauT family transport system ATP-binding protein